MERLTDAELADVVRASNSVEGIFAEPGDPLFDQHFTAAKLVRDSDVYVPVIELHAVLMDGLLASAGEYRDGPMDMVSLETGEVLNSMPRAEYIPSLMETYQEMIEHGWEHGNDWPSEEKASLAFVVHAHGLCIHPFDDGNGRVFRLEWNQLRLRFGFGWMAIMYPRKTAASGTTHRYPVLAAKEAPSFDYVGALCEYEESVFRVHYPDVY